MLWREEGKKGGRRHSRERLQAFRGRVRYLGGFYTGDPLAIVDVSDPTSPRLVSQVPCYGGFGGETVVNGSTAYCPEYSRLKFIDVGRTATRTYRLANVGYGPMILRRLSLTTPLFTLVAPPPPGTVIPAGGSVPVKVRFRPQSAGLKRADLVIKTNRRVDAPALTVSCQGRGI